MDRLMGDGQTVHETGDGQTVDERHNPLQMRYATVNSKMEFSVEQICYLNRPSGDGQTYG
jgi:hypothetical protein